MDFIFSFTKVNDMSLVMVVIDRLTKYTVFVPTPTTRLAGKATTLFLHHVVKHFGVPQNIVSYRDALFMGRF